MLPLLALCCHVASLLLWTSLAWAGPQAKPACIAIVGTSDVHGALAPAAYASSRGATVSADGVLAFSGYVAALRRERGEAVLLVDAGDLFQGTMAVNVTRGRAMIDAYNAMGYDAAAIGNHEFDYGPDAEHPSSPTGSLESAIARARFPFLAANVQDRISQETPLWHNIQRSTMRDIGGVRVGLIGVSTPSTPTGTLAANVRDLTFSAPANAIRAEAHSLRAAGAELIVVLAHMGGLCHSTRDANDLSVCTPAGPGLTGELFATLSALPPGVVDVVIGGHTHNRVAHWYNGTAVVQSGSFGRYFGRVDACVAPATPSAEAPAIRRFDRAHSHIYAPERLCLTSWPDGSCDKGGEARVSKQVSYAGSEVQIDPAVATAVQPHLQMVREREEAHVGASLPRRLSAATIAQLTAEGLRRSLRADFGLQNRGGIRLPLSEGQVRYGDLFRAAPFDNQAVCVSMSGTQIEALIRQITLGRPQSLWPRLAGLAITQVPDGILIRTDKGAALEPGRRYRLATNEFILSGGDGAAGAFAGIATHEIELHPASMRDSLASLLVQLYPMR